MVAVYLAVTQDELSLPLDMAETVSELSKIVGIPPHKIYNAMSRYKARKKKGTRTYKHNEFPSYVKVEIPDEELITDEMWEYYNRWKSGDI